jgi:hypothetical protein
MDIVYTDGDIIKMIFEHEDRYNERNNVPIGSISNKAALAILGDNYQNAIDDYLITKWGTFYLENEIIDSDWNGDSATDIYYITCKIYDQENEENELEFEFDFQFNCIDYDLKDS